MTETLPIDNPVEPTLQNVDIVHSALNDDIVDVVIVGSGPAGLSASVYTARAGLRTVLFSGDTAGGLVSTTEQIDNYLGLPGITGSDAAQAFIEHAESFGVDVRDESVVSITRPYSLHDNHDPADFPGPLTDEASSDLSVDPVQESSSAGEESTLFTVETQASSLRARAVIYAAGSAPRKLGVPGEDLQGVSYCATCDGLFFMGQRVVMVGGGETAAEEALYLSNLVEHVDVLVRGDSWKASEPAVAKIESRDNISIHMNTEITEILAGDVSTVDSDAVSAVILNDGSRRDVGGVFVAVGQSPNSHLATDHCVLADDGFITHPETPGFFVAGDIADSEYRQAVIAAGDGARAGIDATRYLHR